MPKQPRPPMRLWRAVLIVPALAALAVPVFNRTAPTLWGFPFFFWYQMLWVILSAALVGLIFLLEERGSQAGNDAE